MHAHSGGCFLVVDDDLEVLEMFRRWFTQHGFSATTASSLASAERHLRDQTFQAALIGGTLNGESSLPLLHLIQAEAPDTRVVVLSSDAGETAIQEAREAGVCLYLIKPASLTVLTRALLEVCESSMA